MNDVCWKYTILLENCFGNLVCDHRSHRCVIVSTNNNKKIDMKDTSTYGTNSKNVLEEYKRYFTVQHKI